MICSFTRVVCLVLLLLFPLFVSGQWLPIPKSVSANLDKKIFGNARPNDRIAFEENSGQAEEDVRFVAAAPFGIQFKDKSIVFQPNSASGRYRRKALAAMSFVDANPGVFAAGADLMITTSNYLHGSDSSRWIQNVRNFASVNYSNLYPGIDAVFYGSDGSVRYDFKIAKGSDPKLIKLHFRGVSGVAIDANGDLRVRTSEGDLWNRKPVAYQIIEGKRVEVSAEFSRLGKRTFGFKIGTYDPNYDLIIDPLLYATYLGGSRTDFVRDVAVDGSGNIYLASFVNSNDFLNTDPPNGTNQNAVRVTKLSSDGRSIIYNTLINGSNTDDRNAEFHALHEGASPGVPSAYLQQMARYPTLDFLALGRSLHYLQDTFSHAGQPDSYWGHALEGHSIDKTSEDIGKTLEMAKSTYMELSKFSREQCNCAPNPWDSGMDSRIAQFAAVKTRYPFATDIEGYTGVLPAVLEQPGVYSSAAALETKRLILGVPRR